MNKTPPAPPPRVRQPMTAEAISRVRTSKAMSPLAYDNEDGFTEEDENLRQDLFERLQQYYLVYESERVQQGIGHIVDWTMANGVSELNERLRVKYGEGLEDFEERTAKERARNPPARDAAAESFMTQPGGRGNGSFYGGGGAAPAAPPGLGIAASAGVGAFAAAAAPGAPGAASGATIRDRLLAFYTRCDPDRLKKGVDDLVDYVTRKGLPALNEKLVRKYGVTLEQFEAGKAPGHPVPPSPAASVVSGYSAASSASAVANGQRPPAGAGSRVSMRSLLRRSFRARNNEAPPGQLPAFVRPLLELFYSKYDQSKINSGGVSAIYKWAEKHGMRALNVQLKTKYLEDLNEFAERMGKLREDLEDFYRVHDPSKIDNGGVDAILRWGVRNGRGAINTQLRARYGCDLEDKTGTSVAPEPEF